MAFSNNFEKYVFLPSNGIEYSSDVWLKPITNEIRELSINNYNNTEFEYLVQLIKLASKLPTDIENLFLFDFYYLYYTIKIIFIKQDTREVIDIGCSKCNERQKVFMDYGNLLIKQNNFKHKIEDLNIKSNDYNFIFEMRKVRHNLNFPYLCLNLQNIFHKIIIFVWQQIKQISTKNGIIQAQYHYELLCNLHLKDILQIYLELIEYNKIYGIYDTLKFKCKKCDQDNTFALFNDINLSTINISGKANSMDKVQYYKNILSLLQLKIVNLNDFMSLPYADVEHFYTAFNQLDLSLSQRML